MKRLYADRQLRGHFLIATITEERNKVNIPTNQEAQPQQPQHGMEVPQEIPPLWSQPIEVLGVTGDFASGKTLFAVCISPGPSTLIYDTEKSAATYQNGLGFHRMDIPGELLKTHPNGHKSIDVFQWWYNHVRMIKPGQYRVIVLDTVSEIENGLVDYVRVNCMQFGLTANQVSQSAGLLWGAVKDFWKAILSDLSSRCETFVFTSHLKSEFRGGKPTANKVPKGKETLMELASLYLWLERESDKKGNVKAVPAATVLKSRLASTRVVGGKIEIIPTLPPRLPEAFPGAIREYMAAPPDYSKLKAGERLEVHETTVEELETMRLATAEANREAASMELQRMDMARQAYANTNAQQPVQTQQPVVAQVQPVHPVASPVQSQQPAVVQQQPQPTPPTNQVNGSGVNGATEEQANQIRFFVQKLSQSPTNPMPQAKCEEILSRLPNLDKEAAIELGSKLFKLARQSYPDLKAPRGDELKNLLGLSS